jgi:outer membrane lipoprotein-sorting protein
MSIYARWMNPKLNNMFTGNCVYVILVSMLLLIPVFSTDAASNAKDTPALAALKSRFNSGSMYRADLSHQFTDAYTGETTSSFGTIWFTSESYKIDTPDQLILVSKRISTVYNKRQKRVILSTYNPEEDDFAPSRYFSGDAGLYESTEERNSDGSITIIIRTTDPFEQFTEVRIRVARDGSPTQIDAVDQMDNTIRTTFRFGRFEPKVDGLFEFQPPAGTEIVDMRS